MTSVWSLLLLYSVTLASAHEYPARRRLVAVVRRPAPARTRTRVVTRVVETVDACHHCAGHVVEHGHHGHQGHHGYEGSVSVVRPHQDTVVVVDHGGPGYIQPRPAVVAVEQPVVAVAAPAVVQAAPTVVQAAPAVVQAAPTVVQAAPAVVPAAGSSIDPR